MEGKSIKAIARNRGVSRNTVCKVLRSGETAFRYERTFAPGEAYQFDWSQEIVVLGGVTTKVKVAHVQLCHSRMPFVRASPRESQEMVFDAHERAFAF